TDVGGVAAIEKRRDFDGIGIGQRGVKKDNHWIPDTADRHAWRIEAGEARSPLAIAESAQQRTASATERLYRKDVATRRVSKNGTTLCLDKAQAEAAHQHENRSKQYGLLNDWSALCGRGN